MDGTNLSITYSWNDENYTVIDSKDVHNKIQNDPSFALNFFKSIIPTQSPTDDRNVDQTADPNEGTALTFTNFEQVTQDFLDKEVQNNQSNTVGKRKNRNDSLDRALEKSQSDAVGEKITRNAERPWNDHKSIKLLLTEYEKRVHLFRNPKIRNKDLWIQICGVFKEHGLTDYTTDDLSKKLTNMKATYVEKKRNNNPRLTTGRGRKPWPWFDEMDEIFKNDESVNFSTSTFSSISKENIEPINLTVSDTHVAKNMVKNSSNEQSSASTSKSGSDFSNTPKTGPGKVKSSYYQQKKAFIDIGHQRNNIMKDHVDCLTTSQELYREGLLTLKGLTTVIAEKNRILKSFLDNRDK
ncbi:uncharacterized protein LOC123273816 isoform X1 [Cotesia glomerata]|uniref:uncharacterized protein LOC123273816 isoform X1 n=1 Tax=Cotesia glomerata TaxID=32391 RepID=UPI001D025DAC|nr:uncharacterized protein LOC123273816 isoform X1 [Cotesia glomerata]